MIAGGILSPLTTATLPFKTVHADRYGLVRLPAEGPVGHGACGEVA